MSSKQQEWQQRYLDGDRRPPQPAGVLAEHASLLPERGDALDLACGLGGNALFLARRGLQTQGWDYAPAAIDALNQLARADSLPLTGVVRDCEQQPPEPESFDVIAVSYFLCRELIPALRGALRRGGLIYYETFVQESVTDQGPRNPAFRLQANELLRWFDGFRLLAYQEYGRVGDTASGVRDIARLVALKP
jgi:tellurite methyltransferase